MDQAHQLPYAYYRYVDDVWGLWTHGEETLRCFHELANTIHPRIQVTLRFSISFPFHFSSSNFILNSSNGKCFDPEKIKSNLTKVNLLCLSRSENGQTL